MEVTGNAQALIATFAFGIIVLAASGVACLYVKGHGRAFFRDGLRLVLVFFLTTSSLWAIMGFTATLLDTGATLPCQVVIIFGSAFDQMARVGMQQFLLGNVKRGFPMSNSTLAIQIAIFLRFILGGVFIAIQRPQFKPVCVSNTLVVPLGIAVLGVDTVMACIFVVTVSTLPVRKQPVLLMTSAFAVWVATSIPMILGLASFDLVLRTTVPASGLLVLIGTLVICKNYLQIPSPDATQRPLSPSFDGRHDKSTRSRSTQNGSAGGRKRRDKSRQKKEESKSRHRERNPGAPTPPPKSAGRSEQPFHTTNRAISGQATTGVSGGIQSILVPRMTMQDVPILVQKPQRKRILPYGKLKVSDPVLRESSGLNIMNKIAVTDLETAARLDQERRRMQAAATQSRSSRNSASLSQHNITDRHSVTKRKQVPSSIYTTDTFIPSLLLPESDMPSPPISPDSRYPPTPPSPRHSEIQYISGRPISLPVQTQRLPHISTAMSTYSVASMQRDSVPPIPLQNPRRKSRPSQQLSPKASSKKQIFTDPNIPPQIPSPLMREVYKPPHIVASQPKMISPLVPRVEPLPVQTTNWQEEQQETSTSPQYDDFGTRMSMFPRSRSVRNNIRPSRYIPTSPPIPEEKPTVPPKTPVQMRATIGIPINPKSQSNQGVFYNIPATLRAIKEAEDVNRQNSISRNKNKQLDVSESTRRYVASMANFTMMDRPHPISRKSGIVTETEEEQEEQGNTPTARHHRRSKSADSIHQLKAMLTILLQDTANGPSAIPPPLSANAILVQTKETETVVEKKADNVRAQESATSTSAAQTRISDTQNLPSQVKQKIKRREIPTQIPVTQKNNNNINSNDASSSSSSKTAKSLVHSNASLESIRRRSSDTLAVNDITIYHMMEDIPSFPPIFGEKSIKRLTSTSNRSSSAKSKSWHRRVGETCPTFSDRQTGFPSPRKTMMAPKPLTLNYTTKNVVVIETEPSPLESPSHALDVIQQQLDRLDIVSTESEVAQKQRMTLLQNLESEMNVHESHWLQLRQDLATQSARSSLSLAALDSQSNSTMQSPLRRLDTNTTLSDKEISSKDPATMSPSRNSALSQPEELEEQLKRKVAALGGSSTTSLSVPSTISHIASPTPPDSDASDSEYDEAEEVGFTVVHATRFRARETTIGDKLHHPISKKTSAQPPESQSNETKTDANDVTEVISESLASEYSKLIGSESEMDETSAAAAEKYSTSSATSPKPMPPVSPENSRPKTLRPPRRSRRMTQLADIIESPQPLINKRGTLGIFKFPSGETSDNASMSQDVKSYEEANTLSFFALNNEDNEGDNFPIQEIDQEPYSDDEFDEMTLWEIASLLRTDRIPSRNSLLPSYEDSDEEEEFSPRDFDSDSPINTTNYDTTTLQRIQPIVNSNLWVKHSPIIHTNKPSVMQPSNGTWESYMMPKAEHIRVPRRLENATSLDSTQPLWTTPAPTPVAQKYNSTRTTASLWMKSSTVPRKEKELPKLWINNSQESLSKSVGLPQDRHLWLSCSQMPLPTVVRYRSRPVSSAQSFPMESKSLWMKTQVPMATKSLWTPSPAQPLSNETRLLWVQSTGNEPELLPMEPVKRTQSRHGNRINPARVLPELASSSMWSLSSTAVDKHAAKKHWLAFSTVVKMQ